MYSIKQIRQSASWLLCCRQLRQQILSRSIQGVSVFCSLEFVNATCERHYANRHPYILTCIFFAFLKIADFALSYRFSDLISDCSSRLHRGGRILGHRLAGVRELAGAFARLFACLSVNGSYEPHKRYGDSYLMPCAIATGLANHSRHYRQEPLCLVLIQSSSWS